MSLLIYAEEGNYDSCSLALDSGLHPNIQNKGGSTPLIRATIGNHELIVWLLCDHGADPNI